MSVDVRIIGHIVIDHFIFPEIKRVSLGGPPSYAGITSANLGVKTSIATKIGYDFPDEYVLILGGSGLQVNSYSYSKENLTTRFEINHTKYGGKLRLISRCEDISPSQIQGQVAQMSVISPVAGEVPKNIIDEVKKSSKWVYLDPQGYNRKFTKEGYCFFNSSKFLKSSLRQ